MSDQELKQKISSIERFVEQTTGEGPWSEKSVVPDDNGLVKNSGNASEETSGDASAKAS